MIEYILLGVVCSVLLWKEFVTHRHSARLIAAYQSEAALRMKEYKDSQVLVAKLINDGKEERSQYFEKVSEMVDRVMARSANDLAMLTSIRQPQAPVAQSMSDLDEFEQEMYARLQKKGYTQDQIDGAFRDFRSGTPSTPLGESLFESQVNDLIFPLMEGMPHGGGNNTGTTTREPVGADASHATTG